MSDGEFFFFADSVEGLDETDDGYKFRIVASSTDLDRQNQRLTEKAIASMKAQGPIELIVGFGHEAGMTDPTAVIGEGYPDVDVDKNVFVLNGVLQKSDVRSLPLYERMQRNPERIKASIGGKVPEGAMHEVYNAGMSVLELDDICLDHCLICRASVAVNQATAIEVAAASAGWSNVIFKAAGELVIERAASCVCNECGYTQSHESGIPCNDLTCPKCEQTMEDRGAKAEDTSPEMATAKASWGELSAQDVMRAIGKQLADVKKYRKTETYTSEWSSAYVSDLYEDYVVVEHYDEDAEEYKYYRHDFTIEDGEIKLDPDGEEVEHGWIEKAEAHSVWSFDGGAIPVAARAEFDALPHTEKVQVYYDSLECEFEAAVTEPLLLWKAKWSTAYVNALSDSAFLYIDSDGGRHLPVKNKDGNYDCAHLKNAAARANQVKAASESKREELKKKAQGLYKKHCAEKADGAQTAEITDSQEETSMESKDETVGLLKSLADVITGMLPLVVQTGKAEPEVEAEDADEVEEPKEEEPVAEDEATKAEDTPAVDPIDALRADVAGLGELVAALTASAEKADTEPDAEEVEKTEEEPEEEEPKAADAEKAEDETPPEEAEPVAAGDVGQINSNFAILTEADAVHATEVDKLRADVAAVKAAVEQIAASKGMEIATPAENVEKSAVPKQPDTGVRTMFADLARTRGLG